MMTSPFLRFALVLALSGSVVAPLAGCEGTLGASKVARGERYSSGDGRYDPYFDAIHREQTAAKGWPEERENARTSLTTLGSLPKNASDRAIVESVRERAKSMNGNARLDVSASRVVVTSGTKEDLPLVAAVNEATRREITRARKLVSAKERLEGLEKRGKDLQHEVDEERKNAGADKADDKKMARLRELRREVSGAVSVASDLRSDAQKALSDAEKFLDDLDAALQQKRSVSKPDGRVFPPPAAPSSGDGDKSRQDRPKPAGKPAKPATGTPPPPPPPKPAATAEEVFTP